MSPLTINIPKIEQPKAKTPAIIADRRVYLDLAGQTLLEEGHTEARFLLAPEGHPIPGEEVDRLKLVVVDGRVVQNAVVPEPESAQAPEPVPVAQPELEVQTPPEPEAERSAARGKREPK
jgi:hypothetical protein